MAASSAPSNSLEDDRRTKDRLEAILGHDFQDPSLLSDALTHRSAVSRGGMGYERLEFLGDRVLALVISDVLLKAFPTEAEGALAKRLVGLVRRETLAEIGQELDVGAYVRLRRGEEEAGGRDNPAIVADVVEALIAAIYLDDGLAAAARFIETHWRERLERADAPPKDAKTSLQEWTQGRGVQLPEYRMVERSGPDHAPEFVIEVRVAGFDPQTGIGKTKRMAEQVAAARLLEQIGRHG